MYLNNLDPFFEQLVKTNLHENRIKALLNMVIGFEIGMKLEICLVMEEVTKKPFIKRLIDYVIHEHFSLSENDIEKLRK